MAVRSLLSLYIHLEVVNAKYQLSIACSVTSTMYEVSVIVWKGLSWGTYYNSTKYPYIKEVCKEVYEDWNNYRHIFVQIRFSYLQRRILSHCCFFPFFFFFLISLASLQDRNNQSTITRSRHFLVGIALESYWKVHHIYRSVYIYTSV